MKIKPEDLESKGYRMQDELDHKALIPFLKKHLKKHTLSSIFHNAFNFVMFATIVALLTNDYIAGKSVLKGIAYILYGMGFTLLLIPIHELIHGLAYKLLGAENTSFDANLRKFYFMALADQFVANKKEFRIVALAPFVTITTAGFALLYFVSGPWTYSILAAILTHAVFCSGDFGLLSYFDANKGKELVTYDVVATKMSYFYVKELNN